MSAFAHSPGGGPVPPRRRPSQRISRTTPPDVAVDVSLWPEWTKLSLEKLGLFALDADGNPLGTYASLGGGD